ncbi:MAG: YbaB/EbfC family nucleoid-associated protein [Alphaproteobacteria bacterium]|nr:YbaB/EbfC family nucleoid-associated protein [Alphaproteobacteria bacterium]
MNFKNMMKQAQQMQAKMAEAQQRLTTITVEGTSGGGMVKVVVNGKTEAQSIKIDPSIVDKNDVEMLEDLIVAAFNDAKNKAEEKAHEEMSKATSGLPLGDMKLPF